MKRLFSTTAVIILSLLLVAVGSPFSVSNPVVGTSQAIASPQKKMLDVNEPTPIEQLDVAQEDLPDAFVDTEANTRAYYYVVSLLEDLEGDPEGERVYSFAHSSPRLEKQLIAGGRFTLSPDELAQTGVPLAFTGFSFERIGEPTQQGDGSYLVSVYYSRNSYYLRLHGWNWSANDYVPRALGDDAYNVTRVFKYGESLMAFRQSDPLGKTWSLTRAKAGSSLTPTTQEQFVLPTVMPDPASLVSDHGPFDAGQDATNTLDLWDFMSSFGPGAKERYENRVNVYLEKVPVLVGGAAGATDGYLPASPAYFDVTLMTGQQETALNAYLGEARPGFTVNRTLSSAAWLNGPGASTYRPGSPPTWGDTSEGTDLPAQYLDIYYDRVTVTVDFYLDLGGTPATISGKYEEPLFGEARADVALIQLVASLRNEKFVGWYTSPDGFGGLRVDDASQVGYLSVFPVRSLSLFAHWEPDPIEPPLPPDPPLPPIGATDPYIPTDPVLPEAPDGPSGPTQSGQEASGAYQPSQTSQTSDSDENDPTAAPSEPQDSDLVNWAQHALAQTILDQLVPLYGLTPAAGTFMSLGQSPESWSVGNATLCLVGLGEVVLVLGSSLWRSRRGLPSAKGTNNANRLALLLRVLVVSLTLITVTATGLSSSFAKPVVFLDAASPAIIMLFGIQQVVFFSLRQTEKATLASNVRDKHFRAMERFEGRTNFKVHKKP